MGGHLAGLVGPCPGEPPARTVTILAATRNCGGKRGAERSNPAPGEPLCSPTCRCRSAGRVCWIHRESCFLSASDAGQRRSPWRVTRGSGAWGACCLPLHPETSLERTKRVLRAGLAETPPVNRTAGRPRRFRPTSTGRRNQVAAAALLISSARGRGNTQRIECWWTPRVYRQLRLLPLRGPSRGPLLDSLDWCLCTHTSGVEQSWACKGVLQYVCQHSCSRGRSSICGSGSWASDSNTNLARYLGTSGHCSVDQCSTACHPCCQRQEQGTPRLVPSRPPAASVAPAPQPPSGLPGRLSPLVCGRSLLRLPLVCSERRVSSGWHTSGLTSVRQLVRWCAASAAPGNRRGARGRQLV